MSTACRELVLVQRRFRGAHLIPGPLAALAGTHRPRQHRLLRAQVTQSDVTGRSPAAPTDDKSAHPRRPRAPTRPPRQSNDAGRPRRPSVPFPGRSGGFHRNRHEIVVFWRIFKRRFWRVSCSRRVALSVCVAWVDARGRCRANSSCWRVFSPRCCTGLDARVLASSGRGHLSVVPSGVRAYVPCPTRVFPATALRHRVQKRESTPKCNENDAFWPKFDVRSRRARRCGCVGEVRSVPSYQTDARAVASASGARRDAIPGLPHVARQRRVACAALAFVADRATGDLGRAAGSCGLVCAIAVVLGLGNTSGVFGGKIPVSGWLYARSRARGRARNGEAAFQKSRFSCTYGAAV